MCQLNPLRYCQAAVARAFAGITKAYQLVYCHPVLEHNARSKLATIYGHDKSMPNKETIEIFFPFDPYLLKMSSKYIKDNYMVYRSNDSEDYVDSSAGDHLTRKRKWSKKTNSL
uniref:RNA polymerase I-specific transcription initiation factor RRN3-like n=1 Tax=Drosophila rhopaloa TaxID=1041015 RepID=A0A6P4FKC2_DRORH